MFILGLCGSQEGIELNKGYTSMNMGQQAIMKAAHWGAQRAALGQVDNYGNESSTINRKHALDSLAECGMGRFFIDEDGFLEPTSYGTSRTENGESWTHWAVFDLSEVNSYLKFFDKDNDDCQIVMDGESCPDSGCDGIVRFSSRWDCNICSTCRNMYADRENDKQLSTCEVKFGGSHYRGPGMAFANRPNAKVTKRGTRIIVTQHGGYDF
jgi:hypothetical protein